MLSKKHLKLVTSLKQKKFRHQEHLFVVEGIKGVEEFLNSDFNLHLLFATERVFDVDTILISEQELQKLSSLKSPNTVVAIFVMPKEKPLEIEGLILALDDVRDPGNLGTIIRLCDWFGIQTIICSTATVDCYNAKVIQATMGSLTRVNIHYTNLNRFIANYKYDIFGTFMDGHRIYSQQLPDRGLIIMGNEANGISKTIENAVTTKLSIPRFGHEKLTESLNVATATAIVLSEFKR